MCDFSILVPGPDVTAMEVRIPVDSAGEVRPPPPSLRELWKQQGRSCGQCGNDIGFREKLRSNGEGKVVCQSCATAAWKVKNSYSHGQ